MHECALGIAREFGRGMMPHALAVAVRTSEERITSSDEGNARAQYEPRPFLQRKLAGEVAWLATCLAVQLAQRQVRGSRSTSDFTRPRTPKFSTICCRERF
jgi:hypothetical protein